MNDPQVTDGDRELARDIIGYQGATLLFKESSEKVAAYRAQVVAEKQREVDNIKFSLNVMDGLLKSQGETIATMREALLAAEKALSDFANCKWTDRGSGHGESYPEPVLGNGEFVRAAQALTLIHAALNTENK